jgi:hypothetical protein
MTSVGRDKGTSQDPGSDDASRKQPSARRTKGEGVPETDKRRPAEQSQDKAEPRREDAQNSARRLNHTPTARDPADGL